MLSNGSPFASAILPLLAVNTPGTRNALAGVMAGAPVAALVVVAMAVSEAGPVPLMLMAETR